MTTPLLDRLFRSRNQQMHVAVRRNDYVALARLLDVGVDVEFKPKIQYLVSYSGETALHAACRLGHSDCARLLIQRGADVDALAPDGRTPLYRWYQQANRIIQQLGLGKCDHHALPDEFKEVGFELLAAGATLGEKKPYATKTPHEELMGSSPTTLKLEQFMLSQLRPPPPRASQP